MSDLVWQAFYFDGFENRLPPTLNEMIKAENIEEAAKIAKSHMGSCKRAEIVSPRWEPAQHRVVFAQAHEEEKHTAG